MLRAILLAALLLSLVPHALAKPGDATFEVELATTELWERPQEAVIFPVSLRNLAGGPLTLRFEVVEVKGDLIAPVPRPVVLNATSEPTTVPLVVQTPFHNGWVRQAGVVTYRVTPDAGEPTEFSVVVHTKGFYVPGPQIFAAMAAIAVAALIAGARKRA